VEHEGGVGNFKTKVAPLEASKVGGSAVRVLEHGVTIIATGGREYLGRAFLRGEDPRVITQEEFERRLSLSDPALSKAKSIVMIQCVGPWDDDPSQSFYCSRICCSVAIKNAIKMKELHPEASLSILYKDMRTMGLKRPCTRKQGRKRFYLFDSMKRENPQSPCPMANCPSK